MIRVPCIAGIATSQVNAAIAAALALGQDVLFEAGTYLFDAPIVAGATGPLRIGLHGQRGATFFKASQSLHQTFNGSIAGTTLTVNNPGTTLASALIPGAVVSGNGFTRTTIVGPAGAPNTYVLLNGSPPVAAETMTVMPPLFSLGGASAPGGVMRGEVTGIIFNNFGAGSSNDGSTCTVVSNMTSAEFRQCEWEYGDIGVRALNNDFGLSFTDCYAGADNTLNVGLLLDGADNDVGGAGSGNQIALRNAWFTGNRFGVCIAPNNDGINMRDGQFGCATGDGNGAVGLGYDYITSTTGGVGAIILDGNDFEGFGGWAVRAFGQVSLLMQSCPIISYPQGSGYLPAQGVLKIDDPENSRITLIGNNVRGPFVSPKLLIADGQVYPGFHIEEVGGIYDNTAVGANPDGSGGTPFGNLAQLLLFQSGIAKGHGTGPHYAGGFSVDYLDGVLTRPANGGLQVSTDGLTFQPVGQAGLVAPNGLLNAPALVGWYQADHIVGQADGTTITTWPDISGMGHDASQSTPNYQPILAASRLHALLPPSGQPALRFSGANDFFSTTLPADTTLSGVAVFNVTAAPAQQVEPIIGSSVQGGLAVRLALADAQRAVQIEADNVASIAKFNLPSSFSLNQYYVLGWSYQNTGECVIVLNNTVFPAVNSSVSLTSGGTVLIGAIFAGVTWPGQFAEVALYGGALNADQLLSVVQGLMAKYGIRG